MDSAVSRSSRSSISRAEQVRAEIANVLKKHRERLSNSAAEDTADDLATDFSTSSSNSSIKDRLHENEKKLREFLQAGNRLFSERSSSDNQDESKILIHTAKSTRTYQQRTVEKTQSSTLTQTKRSLLNQSDAGSQVDLLHNAEVHSPTKQPGVSLQHSLLYNGYDPGMNAISDRKEYVLERQFDTDNFGDAINKLPSPLPSSSLPSPIQLSVAGLSPKSHFTQESPPYGRHAYSPHIKNLAVTPQSLPSPQQYSYLDFLAKPLYESTEHDIKNSMHTHGFDLLDVELSNADNDRENPFLGLPIKDEFFFFAKEPLPKAKWRGPVVGQGRVPPVNSVHIRPKPPTDFVPQASSQVLHPSSVYQSRYQAPSGPPVTSILSHPIPRIHSNTLLVNSSSQTESTNHSPQSRKDADMPNKHRVDQGSGDHAASSSPNCAIPNSSPSDDTQTAVHAVQTNLGHERLPKHSRGCQTNPQEHVLAVTIPAAAVHRGDHVISDMSAGSAPSSHDSVLGPSVSEYNPKHSPSRGLYAILEPPGPANEIDADEPPREKAYSTISELALSAPQPVRTRVPGRSEAFPSNQPRANGAPLMPQVIETEEPIRPVQRKPLSSTPYRGQAWTSPQERAIDVGDSIFIGEPLSRPAVLRKNNKLSDSQLSLASRLGRRMRNKASKTLSAIKRSISVDRLNNRRAKKTPDRSKPSRLFHDLILKKLTPHRNTDVEEFHADPGPSPDMSRLEARRSASMDSASQDGSQNGGCVLGKLLTVNNDRSVTIQLEKSGDRRQFGFYIARGTAEQRKDIFVSRVTRGFHRQTAGLLGVGDQLLEINNCPVAQLLLDDVYDILSAHRLVTLKVSPLEAQREQADVVL